MTALSGDKDPRMMQALGVIMGLGSQFGGGGGGGRPGDEDTPMEEEAEPKPKKIKI